MGLLYYLDQVEETEQRLRGLQEKQEAEVSTVKKKQEAELTTLRKEAEERAERLQTQLQATAQNLGAIKEEYAQLQNTTTAWPGILQRTVQTTISQVSAPRCCSRICPATFSNRHQGSIYNYTQQHRAYGQ